MKPSIAEQQQSYGLFVSGYRQNHGKGRQMLSELKFYGESNVCKYNLIALMLR